MPGFRRSIRLQIDVVVFECRLQIGVGFLRRAPQPVELGGRQRLGQWWAIGCVLRLRGRRAFDPGS